MSRTTKYREQHVELLAICTELERLLKVDALKADSAPARTAVSRLLGKISLHVASEDKFFYPELTRHADAAVAKMAQQFATDMVGTQATLESFGKKWPTPSSIKLDPVGFCRDAQSVVTAVRTRISREDAQLYAAADATSGAAFAL